MKATQKEADHSKDDSPKAALKAPMSAPMNAPWPDQKARQEMSQSELACEDGKHGKNADWKKKW